MIAKTRDIVATVKSTDDNRDPFLFRCQTQPHTMIALVNTRSGTRYSANGPSIVSQAPPSPKIEKAMGRTQQDAESSANSVAVPSNGTVHGVGALSGFDMSFAFILGTCIL